MKAVSLDAQYFWDRCIPEPNSGCWLWTEAVNRAGYGRLRNKGKGLLAHRAIFALTHNDQMPSSDMDVCHTCDTRTCINPAHLFLGTRKDNMADCARKGRVQGFLYRGDECSFAKLASPDVRAIRTDTRSMRVLAIEYGVSKKTIFNIKHGRSWRSVT